MYAVERAAAGDAIIVFEESGSQVDLAPGIELHEARGGLSAEAELALACAWEERWGAIREPGFEAAGNAYEYVVRPAHELAHAVRVAAGSGPFAIGVLGPKPSASFPVFLTVTTETPFGSTTARPAGIAALLVDLIQDLAPTYDVVREFDLLGFDPVRRLLLRGMSMIASARFVFLLPSTRLPTRIECHVLLVARSDGQLAVAEALSKEIPGSATLWIPQFFQGSARPSFDRVIRPRIGATLVALVRAHAERWLTRGSALRAADGGDALAVCLDSRDLAVVGSVAHIVRSVLMDLTPRVAVTFEHFGPPARLFRDATKASRVSHLAVEAASPPPRPIPGFPFADVFAARSVESAAMLCRNHPEARRIQFLGSYPISNSDAATSKEGDRPLVSFFTQPYDHTATAAAVAAVAASCTEIGADLQVQLHPRDAVSHYPEVLWSLLDEHATKLTTPELVASSDLVVGRTTSVLADASSAGTPFVALSLSRLDSAYEAWYVTQAKSRGMFVEDLEGLRQIICAGRTAWLRTVVGTVRSPGLAAAIARFAEDGSHE